MSSLAVVPSPQSTALAAPAWIELLGPASELAKVIAQTEFVPKDLRGRPAAITAAILTGHELGVQPMTALGNIAIIDGRPALYATLMRALVLGRGHELWFEEASTQRVTIAGRRRGSDEFTRITWSMDDAKRANLTGKKAWREFPRAMLEARCTGELCRLIFADCLSGLMHTVEELQDLGGSAPVETAGEDEAAPTATRRRRRPVTVVDSAPGPAAAEERPPLPGEEEEGDTPAPGAAGRGQSAAMRRLMALFREAGVADRSDRLAIVSLVLQRQVASSRDLADAELDAVANRLEDHRERRVHIHRDEGGVWRITETPTQTQPPAGEGGETAQGAML